MAQRVIQGTVVSNKMDKTVVVAVERRKTHRLYHKVISLTSRFKAHDSENECRLGDVVRIIESRPISRDKRWRVIEVLRKGDVADVAPETIGREIEESIVIRPAGAEPVAGSKEMAEAAIAAAPPPLEAAEAVAETPAPTRAPRLRRPRAPKTEDAAEQGTDQPSEAAAEAPKRRSRAKKAETTEPTAEENQL